MVETIDIVGIDCGLVTVSLFRRVAHHGESKMAAQAGKSSSDRDGENLCEFAGACFGKLML